ncbi:hypothetical protein BEN71_11025 [Acinetobacter wuhouensis]|uniref:hypothetical protein n=1 Tax=Acinetobacter wuhouensis TaxID=1879050 RepID=UPI00083B7305|nr:hypothetical protein [Acinetobacter wuhouensis]AXQ22572.1 hypothetical protein BEN71_11025 [Acinetobacter wuhouensis]
MPIETKDLVIYESERLTDNDDGGGKYNGQIIQDGLSNNLFDDISELDRTMGNVSIRKIFPAVITNDTDKLMGATVFISELPKDPNVSALLFSTKSWTDQRKAAQNRIENYLAKGGQTAGYPQDTHYQGMKTLQVIMFPEETEASVGSTIVLASNEGKALQHEQYVRVTKVETRTAILIIDGKKVEYKVATYSLNDPLDQDYVGLSAKQWYSGEKSQTILRDTLVADTGLYYSSTNLKSEAKVGEFTVNVKDIFAQLIPSAQTESPIVDVNAAGESVVLVPGNSGSISANFSTTVSTSQNLYIGSSVMPSSVSFNLFGQQITDQGGLLKNTQGTQVGTIDYQRGLIQWTSAAGSRATTLAITFTPAASPSQYFKSYSVPVTQNNQSSNWTGVLVPIPAPGCLSISYMAQGKFYELKDDGSGQLKGLSTSFGSGRINYETGSWTFTAGELPDVGTPILLLWGTPIITFVRSGLPVNKAKFAFRLNQGGVATATIDWLLEGVAKKAVSNAQGKFTGDATGFINYSTGEGEIIPLKLPQKNTEFKITYNFGSKQTQTKFNIVPDSAQKLTFIVGTGSPLQPSSIGLRIPLSAVDGTAGYLDLIDVPISSSMGNLVNNQDQVQGTIDYASGQAEVTPTMIRKVFDYIYTPSNVYASA